MKTISIKPLLAVTILISSLVLIATTVTSCSMSKKPSDIEMSIWKAYKNGNYKKGVEIYFDNLEKDEKPSSSKVDIYKDKREGINAFSEKAKERIEKKGGIKEVKLSEEIIDEKNGEAVVYIKVTYNDGTFEDNSTNYVRQDDKWVISIKGK